MTKLLNRAAEFGDFARPFLIIVTRVVIGYLMLLHGLDKVHLGITNVTDFFRSSGVPLAALAAPGAAFIEIVGGVALMIGLAARVFAVFLVVDLFGAIIFVTSDGGVLGGAELEMAYIAALVAIIASGAGRFSLDRSLGFEPSEPRHGSIAES